MFYFKTPQKTFQIGNILVGGQPGENPTVLFGGVRKINEGNKDKVKEAIAKQTVLSQELGVPSSIDLFIRDPGHVQERIDFISDNIQGPFLVDFPFGQLDLKQATLEYISQRGLQDRIIYNSINFATSEEEVALLRRHGISSAILLTVDMANPGTDSSLSLLEKKLLPSAKEAGIEKTLVDPGTMAFDSENIAGEVLRSIMAIKSETGLPTGCAMINLAESWKYFKARKDEGYFAAIASLNSSAQILGADFLIYGPVEIASNIFPSAAVIDKVCAEANRRYFGMKSNIK